MREIVDMPDKKVAQFILFTQQNQGEFLMARRNMCHLPVNLAVILPSAVARG